MFSKEGTFSIKFSSLKEFNDPYEYFLTIDYSSLEPEVLAVYEEIMTMHMPYWASCFSKTPINTPMWAHYADDFQGFSIELNENLLIKYLEKNNIDYKINDIEYLKSATPLLTEKIRYAAVRGKPRDYYIFQNLVYSYAYFAKQECWAYEKERRILITKDYFTNKGNLLWVPNNIISSIIVGHKIQSKLKEDLLKISRKFNIKYFEIRPSKISLNPFFIDAYGKTYVFKDGFIVKSKYYCKKCNEPLNKKQKYCSWCAITEVNRKEASERNAYKILASCDLLEKYIRDMDSITDRILKK